MLVQGCRVWLHPGPNDQTTASVDPSECSQTFGARGLVKTSARRRTATTAGDLALRVFSLAYASGPTERFRASITPTVGKTAIRSALAQRKVGLGLLPSALYLDLPLRKGDTPPIDSIPKCINWLEEVKKNGFFRAGREDRRRWDGKCLRHQVNNPSKTSVGATTDARGKKKAKIEREE